MRRMRRSDLTPSAPIALVGMMGAGKTSIGKRLAARLGRPFADADRELEARCGVPVSTVFELEGEDGFRQREARVIDELSSRAGLVLATGGGAVLLPSNRERLAARCLVVYLRAGAHEIWLRTRRDRSRPLLQTADPRARIEALLVARGPLYLEVADLVVDTGRQPMERVVAAIIDRLPAELRDAAPRPEPSAAGAPARPAALAPDPVGPDSARAAPGDPAG
jgi:shikimate kinase